MDNVQAHWAVVSSCNSSSPRARKWYHVARVVWADSMWFELYWHADVQLRADSLARVRHHARQTGLPLLKGVFRDAEAPRHGSRLRWSLDV